MPIEQRSLAPPKLVAFAKDSYLAPKHPFIDPAHTAGMPALAFGQDVTFASNRRAPRNQDVGKSPEELKPKMRKLLSVFAGGDRSGMAKTLFEKFLGKLPSVGTFEHSALNAAAAKHPNIEHFCESALSAPNLQKKAPAAKTRIHQALRAARWDISKLVAPTDLGVPAFNLGDKGFATQDFNNGLGVMINGVQYAYVIAKSYGHDPKSARYALTLKYVFYDVFGLDDDDLNEYGAASDSIFAATAAIGITAWWQLQHQHGYPPLVTRIVVERTFEAPAA